MAIQLIENTVVAERYKLTRMIGRGGMGTVWQATNVRLDVPCAIKFIEGELAGDAVALARFEREAKAAAQIRSAHVVQILDHGIFHGTPYIAMELLEGEDLGKRLTRTFKMPPRDVAAVVTHVSRALSKAHAMEIVHRDLKPENIFLAWDDDREIVKVLDFGVAKRVQLDVPSHTTAGAMLGTPAYMSPEQAQGAKNVDYRSDLWALAVIAFRCMTGVLPFRSKSLAELLMQIIVNPLPVPSQHAVEIPPGFDMWWARATSREANGRFQSAKELAQALVDALGVAPFSDGLERRVREAAPLPNAIPMTLPYAPTVPRTDGRPASAYDGAGLPLPLPDGRQFASPAPPGPPPAASAGRLASATGSPMARTFGDAPASLAGKPGSSTTVVATAIALIAIIGIAMFMLAQPRGARSRAAGAAAGRAVVPEVVEEEEAPPAVKPSSAPSALSTPSASASAKSPQVRPPRP